MMICQNMLTVKCMSQSDHRMLCVGLCISMCVLRAVTDISKCTVDMQEFS